MWIIGARGPNGLVKVDGKNRRALAKLRGELQNKLAAENGQTLLQMELAAQEAQWIAARLAHALIVAPEPTVMMTAEEFSRFVGG